MQARGTRAFDEAVDEIGPLARRFDRDVPVKLAIGCGRVPGTTWSDQTFVFDSTGTALQDVVAASIALRRAESEGLRLRVAFA